jgi:hypothetical protein
MKRFQNALAYFSTAVSYKLRVKNVYEMGTLIVGHCQSFVQYFRIWLKGKYWARVEVTDNDKRTSLLHCSIGMIFKMKNVFSFN